SSAARAQWRVAKTCRGAGVTFKPTWEDLSTWGALAVAAISLAVSAWSSQRAGENVFYAVVLLPLVLVIAWPEIAAAGWRASLKGFQHGGEGPSPAWLIRIAAWLCLAAVI